ncbi:uncharacterized protein L203_100283 [Cryptococcus depauperatus CBS 7841]|uniref:N-alpha-acetyltransferase 40 n=1 Tax=Cryptococcus depauperatus CBS 7841 TaxID=1295531 RepID=A0AAJ8LYL9_9TREE
MATVKIKLVNNASPITLAPDLPILGRLPNGNPYSIVLLSSSHLSRETKEILFTILDQNMYLLQSKSSFPYTKTEKMAEMFDSDSRFLLLFNSHIDITSQSCPLHDPSLKRSGSWQKGGEIAGFAEFRFDTEETLSDRDAEVVYLYEIQFLQTMRGQGIARKMMGIVEEIGKRAEMEKVMLTCLKSNQGALEFYKKLGYEPDEIDLTRLDQERSGSDNGDKAEDIEVDYVILSKSLS